MNVETGLRELDRKSLRPRLFELPEDRGRSVDQRALNVTPTMLRLARSTAIRVATNGSITRSRFRAAGSYR